MNGDVTRDCRTCSHGTRYGPYFDCSAHGDGIAHRVARPRKCAFYAMSEDAQRQLKGARQ